jgi:very-short-patch-repair endonuclease
MKKNKLQGDESMFKGAPPSSFSKAKSLRARMTEAEIVLWDILKNNQFEGLKFRRQHPVNIYIIDFYCHQLKLVIEIDGGYHLKGEQRIKDIERIKILEFQGLKVIRFTNDEVLSNLNNVLEKMRKVIVKQNSLFTLNPKGSQ